MTITMNNKTFKKITTTWAKACLIMLVGITLVGTQVFAQSASEEQQAAYQAAQASRPCVPGETPGNVYGYLTTETIGNIYLSTESWNDNETAQTSVEFYVTYDRQLNRWGGRGWNELAGWVDFGLINPSNTLNQTAEFANVKADPINYGNWNSLITGLGNVNYNQDTGQFVGTAINEKITINGGNTSIDDLVGAGEIGFEHVEYQTELTGCDETVNLFLNGVSTLYKSVCPISTPKITWTSESVIDCETDAGLWQNPGSRNPENTVGENASSSITTANSPQLFRLKCTGEGSGSTVYGTAIASCGPTDPNDPGGGSGGGTGIDPTSGIVIPDFKEV